MAGPYQFIRYSAADGIAEIVLDRPPLNLVHEAMTREYFDALAAADTDPEVRVVVLSGAGKGLSGGMDLKHALEFGEDAMKAFLELFYVEQMRRCRAMTKPMIAMVHGFAQEGGCTMAYGCDMVIAADDAKFGYPGVPNAGIPPGMHVWFLQKIIGRMKAAELIYTGKSITALEAERLGLITRAVPAAKLRDETMQLAARVAAMSPHTLKIARRFMYDVEDLPFSEVPEASLKVVSEAFGTEDSLEARRAFAEKRKPVWKGR
jgi:enoyl-CoA hydratase/carnithine racemase